MEATWPTAYRAQPQQEFSADGYTLLPIRWQDRQLIRRWRNEQLAILRQKAPITAEQQDQYFRQVVQPLFGAEQPGQLLFSLLHEDELIGYGGLVHLDWEAGRGEISFLLNTARNADVAQFQRDFAAYLGLLQQVAFGALPFHKINTEAYDVRPYLFETLRAAGFVEEARLHQHVRVDGVLVDTVFHACFRPLAPLSAPPAAVLVTSISRKVPLLRAVRAAAQRWHFSTRLIGADVDAQCLGRHFVDEFWPMPALRDLSPDDLLAYCRAHHVQAIIPTRDGELLFWARHRAALAAAGVAVLVSEAAAVETCLDKLLFAQHLTAHGFPAIPTALQRDELPAATERFVVKERFGAGSVSLGLNLTAEAADAHAATLPAPVYQPFVAGQELSVDVYVDAQGRAHGGVARRRDEVRHGESQVTTTVEHPALVAQCQRLAESLGLYGPAVFQVLETPAGALHFIECNARFGGASTASVAAGLRVFDWFLREALSPDGVLLPFQPRPGQWRQIRFPADVVVPAPFNG